MTVPVEGEVEIIELAKGTLADEIHSRVGGYFECIQLATGVYIWLNEDGKGMRLPLNPNAQMLWDAAYGVGSDFIVGDAVLTGPADRNGDTLGLSDAALHLLSPFPFYPAS